SLFEVLGVRPFLGHTFTGLDEPGRPDDVAVLSYDLWQRKFGGDPAVIGRSVQMNRRALLGGKTVVQSLTVIGVSPKGFAYPLSKTQRSPEPQRTEIWTPFVMTDAARAGTDRNRYLDVVGRLRADARLEAAQSQTAAVAAAFAAAIPTFPKAGALRVI